MTTSRGGDCPSRRPGANLQLVLPVVSPPQLGLQATHQRAQVDRSRLAAGPAAHDEQLLHERPGTLRRGDDLVQVAAELVARAGESTPGMAVDHRDHVVQVVRDAARDTADGLVGQAGIVRLGQRRPRRIASVTASALRWTPSLV